MIYELHTIIQLKKVKLECDLNGQYMELEIEKYLPNFLICFPPCDNISATIMAEVNFILVFHLNLYFCEYLTCFIQS